MKNIKNIIITITSFTAIITSGAMQAAPNFEIYNKSSESINVTLSTPKGNKVFKVDPNQALQDSIDTSAGISLNIISPKYEASFKLKCNGKTAYVSWNSAKKMPLYPQTGPLMGLMGKTESGLSLSNNIKSSDFGVSVVKEQ